jgi:acyl-CoA synthetase (AMP-forming)/AMP-acid ligase II
MPTQSITLEDLQAFAKQRMAPYKVPTVLRVLEAIPRNAMGKINKKALVKELFG